MARNKQWKAIQVDWETLQDFSDDEADYAYYKLTPRQAAFCQAWLDFGNWATRWVNLSDTMDNIRKFVSQTSLNLMIENAIMIDCSEVDDCLETAPTIISIEQNVATNTASSDTNSDNLENLFDNPQDGNFYNPPIIAEQTDIACQTSGYIVDQLSAFIAQIDTYSTEPDILTALFSALNGDYLYTVNILRTVLYNFIVGGALPLAPVFDAEKTDLHEFIYCNNDFSKDSVSAWVRANMTRGAEIADEIDCMALSLWQQWQTMGQDATGYDCSSFTCGTWCYEFDFSVAPYWAAGGRANVQWSAAWQSTFWDRHMTSSAHFSIYIPIPIGTVITEIQVQDEITGALSNNKGLSFGDVTIGTDTFIDIVRDNDAGQTHGQQTRTYPVNYTMTRNSIQYHVAGTGTSGQTRYIMVYRIKLSGVGVDPMLNGVLC